MRFVKKEKEAAGPGSAAQDALRAQLEANKKERKAVTKQQKLEEEEEELRWQLSREKAKKKHRGK